MRIVIPEKEIEWTITPEPETENFSEYMRKIGADDFKRYAQKLKKEHDGNVWLWCEVTVQARWKTFIGETHLTACCYPDEETFKKDCLEDMKPEALQDLQQAVLEYYLALKDVAIFPETYPEMAQRLETAYQSVTEALAIPHPLDPEITHYLKETQNQLQYLKEFFVDFTPE